MPLNLIVPFDELHEAFTECGSNEAHTYIMYLISEFVDPPTPAIGVAINLSYSFERACGQKGAPLIVVEEFHT